MENERGQVLPAVVLLLAGLVVGASVLLGYVGRKVGDEATAQTAADAAALAGAVAGEPAARLAAERNGGRLRRWEARGTDAIVMVEVGESRAEARARRSPNVGYHQSVN